MFTEEDEYYHSNSDVLLETTNTYIIIFCYGKYCRSCKQFKIIATVMLSAKI